MNAILGFSELLRTQMAASKDRNYLDAISSSGRTLLTLINDILDLSKIEAGKLELQYEPVSVARLVEEIQKLFSIKAGEKGIKLLTEIDPKLPRGLMLDEVRLRQVLFNVVGNALKFTEKGQVRIRARCGCGSRNARSLSGRARHEFRSCSLRRAAGRAELRHQKNSRVRNPDETRVTLILEVSDTGIGIPKDQQETHLRRVLPGSGPEHAQVRRHRPGTDHHQTPHRDDARRGHGAERAGPRQHLPIRLFRTWRSRSWPSPTRSRQGGEGDFTQFAPATILVADDVALNRALLTGYFEGTGHKLVIATNGLEALELAEKHRPDVILMDMRMPELDGHETTKRLKANPALKHIPVIAVTASSFREEEARAREDL